MLREEGWVFQLASLALAWDIPHPGPFVRSEGNDKKQSTDAATLVAGPTDSLGVKTVGPMCVHLAAGWDGYLDKRRHRSRGGKKANAKRSRHPLGTPRKH